MASSPGKNAWLVCFPVETAPVREAALRWFTLSSPNLGQNGFRLRLREVKLWGTILF